MQSFDIYMRNCQFCKEWESPTWQVNRSKLFERGIHIWSLFSYLVDKSGPGVEFIYLRLQYVSFVFAGGRPCIYLWTTELTVYCMIDDWSFSASNITEDSSSVEGDILSFVEHMNVAEPIFNCLNARSMLKRGRNASWESPGKDNCDGSLSCKLISVSSLTQLIHCLFNGIENGEEGDLMWIARGYEIWACGAAATGMCL